MKRKHICILYPYGYLPYSPTVINLYDQLASRFRVTIVCSNRELDNADALGERNICRVSYDREALYKAARSVLRVLRVLGMVTPGSGMSLEEFLRLKSLKRSLDNLDPDEIIAVDIPMLWTAQRASRRPIHFLSLELRKTGDFVNVDTNRVASVLIESPERLRYVFGERDVRAFFVPVSPVYVNLSKPPTAPGSLLYFGSATGPFGLYSCLHFLSHNPGFVLTIRGIVKPQTFENIVMSYPELLDEGRLTIEREYIAEEKVLEYISGFRIGLCFYDTRFEEAANFHFRNVNSQKVYRYLAGGVPVVANRLEGLKAVEEYEAGILVDDMSPASIRSAIDRIEQDYDRYVGNCFRAAEHFSFDRHLQPFVQYLEAR